MNPTMNDVLSGRGAWFNQHPGNKHFRTILEGEKDAYMTGTKKQKMDISKTIVESIHSMDPPGRFLKKCPDTGQWNELSRKDAADRAAQAMAYVIKGESLKEKRKRRRLGLPPSSLSTQSQAGDTRRNSSQSVDPPTRLQQQLPATTITHLGFNQSSSVANHGLATRREGTAGTWDNMQFAREPPHKPVESNLRQELLLQPLQQSNTTNNTLPTSASNFINQSVDQNGVAQPPQQLLQQHQYSLDQNPLGQLLQSQAALQPALYEGMNNLLNRAQQQLFPQSLQQNVHSSASLPQSIPTPTPFLTMSQYNPVSNNSIQQQSNAPLNTLSLGSLLNNRSMSHQPNSSVGISNANQPQQMQQTDQFQRSILQQNQFLASTYDASSSNRLPFQQQQQLQLLDLRVQQTLQATPQLQLVQNSQVLPPPPTNFVGMDEQESREPEGGK